MMTHGMEGTASSDAIRRGALTVAEHQIDSALSLLSEHHFVHTMMDDAFSLSLYFRAHLPVCDVGGAAHRAQTCPTRWPNINPEFRSTPSKWLPGSAARSRSLFSFSTMQSLSGGVVAAVHLSYFLTASSCMDQGKRLCAWGAAPTQA